MKGLAALSAIALAASIQGCDSPPEVAKTAAEDGSSASGRNLGVGGREPVSDRFELVWEDDFDAFDGERWELRGHTFEENAAYFVPGNVVVEDGLLKMKITSEPVGGKEYSAAEVRTNEEFTWGRFEARFKPAPGSGLVSSLFTYLYIPWNEIDIEYLGHRPRGVQYNLITEGASGREYQPYFQILDFQPAEDFHDYAFEWTPSEIRFFVDGVPMVVETTNVSERLTHAVRLHINCWPTNNDVTYFAGVLDPSAIPAEAQYDWVRVYRYVE